MNTFIILIMDSSIYSSKGKYRETVTKRDAEREYYYNKLYVGSLVHLNPYVDLGSMDGVQFITSDEEDEEFLNFHPVSCGEEEEKEDLSGAEHDKDKQLSLFPMIF